MVHITSTNNRTLNIASFESENKKSKKERNLELTEVERQIREYQKNAAQNWETGKQNNISNKIITGSNLTPEEIKYLKDNMPDNYKEYEEAKIEKKRYEEDLKNCKTKDDVDNLKTQKLGLFASEAKSIASNPYIPKAKKIGLLQKIIMKTSAIAEVHDEFVESRAYDKLSKEQESSSEDNMIQSVNEGDKSLEYTDKNNLVEEPGLDDNKNEQKHIDVVI